MHTNSVWKKKIKEDKKNQKNVKRKYAIRKIYSIV